MANDSAIIVTRPSGQARRLIELVRGGAQAQGSPVDVLGLPLLTIVPKNDFDTVTAISKALTKAKINNKTIILTGAMIPYEFGSSSDGFFNLGCALSYVQTLQSGVYITMQGQYFKWDKVIKNSKKGFFEKL